MGAVRLQSSYFKDEFQQNQDYLLNARFGDLIDRNQTRYEQIVSMAANYNKTLPGRKKGKLKGSEVTLLFCFIYILEQDMNRLRKSNPAQYLALLQPDCKGLEIFVSRPSMVAIMKSAGAPIGERTTYDAIKRIMEAGDQFIIKKRNLPKRTKQFTQPDGTKKTYYRNYVENPDGTMTAVWEPKENQTKAAKRGPIGLTLSKKMLVWVDSVLQQQNYVNIDNQLVAATKRQISPQSMDNFLPNQKYIKNNPPQGQGLESGAAKQQNCYLSAPNGTGDKDSRNEDGKNPPQTRPSAEGPSAAPEVGSVSLLSKTDYRAKMAEFDRFIAQTQPKNRMGQYAQFLYLMINEVLYPDNTSFYIQIAQEECLAKIEGLMRETRFQPHYAYKYLAMGVLKARNWLEDHPDYTLQNIKYWLNAANPNGFKAIVLDKWLPEYVHNMTIAQNQSIAKRQATLCYAQSSKLAFAVIERMAKSHHSAGQLLLKNYRNLKRYFAQLQGMHQRIISDQVKNTCLRDYLDRTRPVWTKLKMMAMYIKDPEWAAYEAELELLPFLQGKNLK